MTKIKTAELGDPALDWLVAKCEGVSVRIPTLSRAAWRYLLASIDMQVVAYHPSTNWSQGGPIIEREGISTIRCDNDYGVDEKGFCNNIPIPVWAATTGHHTIHMKRDGPEVYLDALYYGPTALVAAMRCYVASKLGDEVDIPEELS